MTDEEAVMLDHAESTALQIAEDLADKPEVLAISRKLDDIPSLTVRKQIRTVTDPDGDECRTRSIRSHAELHRTTPASWALRSQAPSYWRLQFATLQLPMRERVTRTSKRQALFVLSDASGSMKNERRHLKAYGVVLNRLQAAVRGDAVVWLSLFDDALHDIQTADSAPAAVEVAKRFRKHNYTGRGTDIAAAVKSAHKHLVEVLSTGEFYRPEILVVTDDDTSSVNVVPTEIPGTRVHAVAVCKNASLMRLARATGGIGLEI